MRDNRFYNPVRTIQGAGSLRVIPELVRDRFAENCRVLLLAWNERVFELDAFRQLGAEGCSVREICFTESNPTVEQLFEVYSQTREFSPQLVIAVGRRAA